jgi:hypothetical protein
MKDRTNKSQYNFKPFDSLDWNNVSEKELSKALSKEEIEILKKNKHYNTGVGTFKIK